MTWRLDNQKPVNLPTLDRLEVSRYLYKMRRRLVIRESGLDVGDEIGAACPRPPLN